MDMEKLDLKPDIYTFSGLLLIMSRDKEDGVGVARGVWSEMTKSAVVPDLHCHNKILLVLRDGGLQGVVKEPNHTPDQPAKILEVPSVTTFTMKQLVSGVATGKKEDNSPKTTKSEKSKSDEETLKDAASNGEKAKNTKTDSGEVSTAVLDVARKVDWKWKKEYAQLHERLGEIEKTVVYLRGEVTFELSRAHRLVLKVGGCQVKGNHGNIRWLEKSSIESFFAYMKKNRVKPDIHCFHLLGHLATDPAHLLVTMQERKVVPDAKFMTAMIMQHSKYFHNLQGALVRCGQTDMCMQCVSFCQLSILFRSLWCKEVFP